MEPRRPERVSHPIETAALFHPPESNAIRRTIDQAARIDGSKGTSQILRKERSCRGASRNAGCLVLRCCAKSDVSKRLR